MKRVLFLSYFFPPMGGAGVQRATKFAKYLPSYGYLPFVVAGNGEFLSRQENDKSLAGEVADMCVRYIDELDIEKTFDAISASKIGRYIPGIEMTGWSRAAMRDCLQIIDATGADVLLATVSPFPAAVVARRVAAFKKLPWVLDMRDPWALDPITFYPTRLHYKYQLKKMAAAAHAATSVIMNTPASLTALRKAFPSLPKEKLFCITNGWDSADFTSLSSCVSGKEINSPALTIVHIGQFHTQYAVNVDCARRKELLSERKRMSDWFRFSSDTPDLLCRSPYYLFAALRQLLDTNTIAPGDVRCIFIGAQSTADTCLVDRFSLEGMVEFTGYLDHTSCLKKMEQADVLMLPLHKPASGSDPLIVPGKAYEYMASGKPIWGLVPQGDCRNLLLRAGVGVVSEPDDVEGIAQRIAGFIKEKRDGRALQMQPNREYIDSFERSVLTARLAEVLDYSIKAHAN